MNNMEKNLLEDKMSSQAIYHTYQPLPCHQRGAALFLLVAHKFYVLTLCRRLHLSQCQTGRQSESTQD